ncbi:hypothetical protein OROGR_025421 [Orobanche gracilis]
MPLSVAIRRLSYNSSDMLFLDVIFPLALEKVIFVDADQIVRTDIGELYDMDIRGRPLAYTPFCDNNKDMDIYRFWKQGFWKDHLRGRPYHISELRRSIPDDLHPMAAILPPSACGIQSSSLKGSRVGVSESPLTSSSDSSSSTDKRVILSFCFFPCFFFIYFYLIVLGIC